MCTPRYCRIPTYRPRSYRRGLADMLRSARDNRTSKARRRLRASSARCERLARRAATLLFVASHRRLNPRWQSSLGSASGGASRCAAISRCNFGATPLPSTMPPVRARAAQRCSRNQSPCHDCARRGASSAAPPSPSRRLSRTSAHRSQALRRAAGAAADAAPARAQRDALGAAAAARVR